MPGLYQIKLATQRQFPGGFVLTGKPEVIQR
jgi:hypothetical protein